MEVAMATLTTPPSIKVIGANGQISLGKQFAGRQVLVEEQEPGVWLVRTATVIPDNELWLHTPEAQSSIQEGLRYFAQNEPRATDPHQIFGDMIDGHTQQRTTKRPARPQRTKLPA